MISQALINLLKNAGEAIESRINNDHHPEVFGQIEVNAVSMGNALKISIVDNGVGLPEDRNRLFEPYVTTRENGTGLGLAIVKKIIEEHGGMFSLEDAPPFSDTGIVGAAAVIELPLYNSN
jgi:two-component system nitrogen regulation sensor histidine kinase NtrY